jgi:hypothetical protein
LNKKYLKRDPLSIEWLGDILPGQVPELEHEDCRFKTEQTTENGGLLVNSCLPPLFLTLVEIKGSSSIY